MEDELKTVSKLRKATTIQDALQNIDRTLLRKDSKTSKEHGKTSLTTLQTKQVKIQLEQDGKGHGFVGCAKLSNGEMVTSPIKMGTHGLPVMPPSKGQNWLFAVDQEISTEIYESPRVYKLTLENERQLMPTLIQLDAATRVSPYADIILRLARLKTIKPTANMDEEQTAVFFGEIANMLIDEGFCYTAIDEGIMSMIRKQAATKGKKDKWFPAPETLIEYIYPIHWKMKRRKDKLHEMLTRPQKAIGEDND